MKIEINEGETEEQKPFLFREIDESKLPFFVRDNAAGCITLLCVAVIVFGCLTMLAPYIKPGKEGAPELIVVGLVALILSRFAW